MNRIFIGIALAAALFSAPASAKFDPAFTWITIETPHFLIHYHQGEEELAQRAARIAEEEHARLVPRIKWEPREKTHLVFVDRADFSMGSTMNFLTYNHIIFLTAYPHGQTAFPVDFLRVLIAHEYTHVLQIDMVHGPAAILQKIAGRVYFPNYTLFQPTWMIEGLADYEAAGQLFNGYVPGTDMIVRMAVLEDRLPTLDRMSTYFVTEWPGMGTPYIFGESFIHYLSDTYGRDKVADISVEYSGRIVPFLVNATGERVLNKSYEELWGEWKQSLEVKYRKQRDEIAAKGITASFSLTRRGYANANPSFSPDGTKIAYTVSNADEFPGIYIMNADGTDVRKLVENAYADGSLSWSPDGSRLYYSKLDFWRNTNQFNDLYYYDLKKRTEERLTRGLRARDPHPSPDGAKLLFVMNRLSKTRLASMNISPDRTFPAQENDVMLLTEESTNQYATPRFSPDGSKIAASVATPEGYADIWVLDAQGKKMAELSHDRANDFDPAWSPDGNSIYFASNRTGVNNLYAYELGKGEIIQVTNVLGGALQPSPSPDNKTLAFASYSSIGYDIHTIAIDASTRKPAEPFIDPYPAMLPEVASSVSATRPYSPVSTILPHYWIPAIITGTEEGTFVGFTTSGHDVVQRHRYDGTVAYGSKLKRAGYLVNYFYDGLYPTLHVQASDMYATYGGLLSDPTGTRDYVERNRSYDLSVAIPVMKTAMQQQLTIGYRRKESSHLTDLTPWAGYNGPMPSEGTFASGYASYLFNNSRKYGYSASQENGRAFALGYERFDKSLGSDYAYYKFTADWHEFIDLPKNHHVLLARAFVGTSNGDSIPAAQRVFQIGGYNPGDVGIFINSPNVYLRGYPTNSVRGQKAGLAMLEYRFPIRNVEHGWDSKPVFMKKTHGAVFVEAGNAWDGTFSTSDLKRSVGIELKVDLVTFYAMPITWRIGYAQALDEPRQGRGTLTTGLFTPLQL